MQQLYFRPFAEVVAGICNERKSTLTRGAARPWFESGNAFNFCSSFSAWIKYISLHFTFDSFLKIDASRCFCLCGLIYNVFSLSIVAGVKRVAWPPAEYIQRQSSVTRQSPSIRGSSVTRQSPAYQPPQPQVSTQAAFIAPFPSQRKTDWIIHPIEPLHSHVEQPISRSERIKL